MRYRLRQRAIRRLQRDVGLAGEKPQERPPPQRGVVANGSAQHRIARLQRVHDGSLRDRSLDRELHLAVDGGVHPQMRRQDDADHGSVCTSTESTAGRSRTMADQLSPASLDT